MNHNITDDYCSLEVSKLLKAKGFMTYCTYSFWKGEFTNETPGYPLEDRRTSQENYHKFERYYSPTHAIAIKWLRENFGIHIYVDRNPKTKDEMTYFFVIKTGNGWQEDAVPFFSGDFDTHEDATDTSILYALRKLV